MPDVVILERAHPPGSTAAAAPYVTKQERRAAVAAVHALVPAGACVIDMLDAPPRKVKGDPMEQRGWVGLKWMEGGDA